MSDLEALLAGIVADAESDLPWLVLADWLEEFDDSRRAELTRLHLQLRQTCTEPDAHPERAAWHSRILELMEAGAKPCVPERTLVLPGNVELKMVFIPPGAFRMGSNSSQAFDHEKPVHIVTLTQGFWIGIHEVTQEQYEAVMGENPSEFKGRKRPVEQVSWDEAQEFCKKASPLAGQTLQLPTEAQWEYACRAGSTTEYCNGDDEAALQRVGWYRENSKNETHAVGELAANAWGLHDCHGNVWEWCNDVDDAYKRGDCTDPVGPQAGSERVIRGGSWLYDARLARAAFRDWIRPDSQDDYLGFRCLSSVRLAAPRAETDLSLG